MKFKDLKYIFAYSIPVVAIIGLILRGYWSFLAPVFAFVFVPILEILLPIQAENLSENESISKKNNFFFDILLYINIPLVFGILIWFLWSFSQTTYTPLEIVGLTFSVGLVMGSNGINVAHELGHRKSRRERTLGKLLLIPALYMHFYMEHNYGHHPNAATKEDPATARYNQPVFSFWITSVFRQYISAWKIQKAILLRNNNNILSINNDMFWYLIFQLSYLVLIFFLFNVTGLIVAIVIAIIGVVLLETINYVEHYGLSRNKTNSGRYERLTEIHSWNSNHIMGRIMLYELTRHSDHHYRSYKKYQTLDCHENSPEMPFGYPTSIVLSLIPPLWFAIMNKRIPLEMRP